MINVNIFCFPRDLNNMSGNLGVEMLTDSDINRLLLERSEPDPVSDFFGEGAVAYENQSDESDVEIENLEEEHGNSDSEVSVESDSEADTETGPYILGKNGHRWNCHALSRRGRPSADNIVSHFACVKGEAKLVKLAYQSWKLLINEDMISEITNRTNEEISLRKVYDVSYSFNKSTDPYELLGLFGLYYAAGMLKDS